MTNTIFIKGHKERGDEVVSLLETLGGKITDWGFDGDREDSVYFISFQSNKIDFLPISELEETVRIFTLEEFESTFYKVGDLVKYDDNLPPGSIQDIVWNGFLQSPDYFINGIWFRHHEVSKVEINDHYTEPQSIYPIKFDNTDPNNIKIIIDEGYELKTKNDGSVYVCKIKPTFPKTYKECCKVLGIKSEFTLCNLQKDEYPFVDQLITLKRCRDAYWKIDNDWKPKSNETCYSLYNNGEQIVKLANRTNVNRFLSFRTDEILCKFHNNFGFLINSCKEIL